MTKKALIAMSGGVDSSVAALLMQQQGYDCTGVTMQLFDPGAYGKASACGTSAEIEDAQRIARQLQMNFIALDFSDGFEAEVIRRFVHAYENGWTPNPCIDCNRHMKFDQLFRYMQNKQLDTLVTGHYARTHYDAKTGRYLLQKGLEPGKDQSYVLYHLTQQQLAHIRFPVGEFSKADVREIAEQNGFFNAAKPDSQDICFIPDGDYAAFIQRYTGKTPQSGFFLNTEGAVIGTHKGVIHYTIGQRRGLGISAPQPLYVCAISVRDNTVTLGKREELFARELTAEAVNLIAVPSLDTPMAVTAKVRYRHPAQPAVAWQTSDGRLHVRFEQPQRAITCGQAVVLYQDDIVVGGGTICDVQT